jgi:RsiW-degrading membrane proteinase PrsW (M82 family)
VTYLVRIAVSLIPVFAFLGALVLLDSFKLVRPGSILRAILVGCAVAVACLFLNRWMLGVLHLDSSSYGRYLAPVVEEALKASFIIYLVARRRVGFLVDAAILGFAVGAGFAFVENVYYLRSLEEPNLLLWIVRGLGTAVMHGGTTAAFAVLSQGLAERGFANRGRADARGAKCATSEPGVFSRISGQAAVFLPGLALAIGVHSLFNQFVLSPVANTIAQMLVLPVVLAVVFNRSERGLRRWLEAGLDSDVQVLEYITTGAISDTHTGRYLESLRTRFPGEVVADMLCLLRTHLELAVRAKGILLMREAGFPVRLDAETSERLEEMKFLERSIGATGRLAVSPILHASGRDRWQLHLLGKK